MAMDGNSSACVAQVHEQFRTNGSGFWVGASQALKLLTVEAIPRALRQCVPHDASAPLLVLDVGAGIHGIRNLDHHEGNHVHPDDSDSLWLLRSLRDGAEVHAYEPNYAKALELPRVAARRKATKNYTAHYYAHPWAVGEAVGHSCLRMGGGTLHANRWRSEPLRDQEPCQDNAQGQGNLTYTTTIEAEAARLSASRRVAYAKIDCEGGEVAVIRGSRRLLEAGLVELMSVEYAVGWRETHETLKSFAQQMSALGYDTYLTHGGKLGATLFPVYGAFWHDDFEICDRPKKVYGGKWHCWNDLLVVRRGNVCLRSKLMKATNERVLPGHPAPRGARHVGKLVGGVFRRAFPACALGV